MTRCEVEGEGAVIDFVDKLAGQEQDKAANGAFSLDHMFGF